ncbi:concanavalin A-like lectin/glucanase protein [Rhizobium phage RHph_TM3_3_9]|nr:concanavalin A-like lectin/glucanase protein [Rhizobium phage RHph_TM3_3_9]QIG68554.1 concanavalin A-like lectin/glucanase protein [Rhizobium phage RHph_TM3_3_13]QIG74412.1 concanavalin A-like lectin/glucanase protein [Rhizobium phage RHph_TM3_3_10]QXV74526.1 concanavalin A-like lectin/glucanase protein [Rhizobium phage RHEph19]
MAVILPSTYTDGTAVCTNGSPNVVGTGTMWLNTILPGDFFWTPSGESVRILTVVDDTHITLAYNWPGATQATGPYEIRFQSDQGRVQETTRQLLERMQSGNLYAFAGLNGLTDTVPYFTGPGAMGLLTREELTNGVNYDVQVDTLPDRDAYDTQATGFTVLVSDTGDGRAAVYFKNSVTTGDWSAPAYVTGPRGLRWRGEWSNATAYDEDDAVSYNGASYIALVGNTNVTPVAGATWGSLAARGATGLTGMTPRGTYSAATAYVATDAVLYNGSTYVAIAPTTGNAPPTPPTTSNAWWQLLALKGTDGTGTGDVVGPAGVTDGSAAMFNGVTGKLIKAATPSEFRTWLGQTAATVSFNNSVANLPGAPTTTQAAIESLAANSGGKNDSIFALEIADLKGQRAGMNGGIADAFDDTSGVNLSSGGIDVNTLLMLHCDGLNNSTSFPDSSSNNRTVTAVADAKVSTSQSVFGGASAVLDGTGDYLSIPDSDDFAFGTGNFTIDLRVRVTANSVGGMFCSHENPGTPLNCYRFYVAATGAVYFQLYSANTLVFSMNSATGLIALNTWYHVALVRNGNVFTIYINGVSVATTTNTASIPNYTGPLKFGMGPTSNNQFLNGFLDEIRVSNVARWTANFTPPATAYYTDTSSSQNYIYDATNDWFIPTGSTITSAVPSAATITQSSTYTIADRALVIPNNTTVVSVGIYADNAGTQVFKILRRVSSTTYDVLVSYSFSHPGGGWYDYVLPTPYLTPATGTLVPATVQLNAVAVNMYDTSARGFHTGDVAVANGVTGWLENGTAVSIMRLSYLVDNMTLISTVYPAASVPTSARIALQLADSVTLVPNTDFSAEVSRDGGTTWTVVTLALTMNFNGLKVYEGTVSLTGQPSGSNMQWRVKSLTNKIVIASGVVLQQS